MPLLSLVSNPHWRPLDIIINTNPASVGRKLLSHADTLQPGTLWQYDEHGFKSPANGRAITVEEEFQLREYNSQRKELNDAGRKAIDALMQRVVPLCDMNYKDLTDFQWNAIHSDISWLSDHPAGSDFYALESGMDELGDWTLSRLQRYLKAAGLEFDIEEL